MLNSRLFFYIYEPKISIYDIYTSQCLSLNEYQSQTEVVTTMSCSPQERMFQMTLLLLRENNCSMLFRNPCINVEVLAQTSSIYSLGAETRTQKSSPHKCLIQILIIYSILNQKLNDATLASLGKLKYSRWRPRWLPKG